MRSIIAVLICLVMLLGMVACNKDENISNEGADPLNSSQTESNLTDFGFDSENELLKAYIMCLNGEGDTKKFFDAFDPIGYYSYWITEMTAENYLTTVYDAFIDSAKGVAYLNEYYADFWEEQMDISQLTGNHLDKIKSGKDIRDNTDLKQAFQKFVGELSDKYRPFEMQVDPEYKKEWYSEYGYYGYDIPVNATDEYDYTRSVGIYYIMRNGKYYWIMLHQTA